MKYKFINVSNKVEDEKLKEVGYSYAVIKFDGKKYYIDNDLTLNLYNGNGRHNGKVVDVGYFVKNYIDNEKYAVEYTNTPYIINGEEKQWLGAVLITNK